jgi:beta-lactam-binding protein with PASTA domain
VRNFISFLVSKTFWINIAVMVGIVGVGIFVLSQFFDSYTRHEEYVEVPDFNGFHYSELKLLVAESDVHYIISDSVFDPEKPRGIVLDQIPKAGDQVKPGRKIYLTINATIPPSVLLPELMDYTVRQAVNKIPTYGLSVDSIIYRPAECDNCVIGVLYNGEEISAGTLIERGKSISLIVGMGFGNERIVVPYLYKLGFNEAKEKLYSLGLNVGFVDYDTTITTKSDSDAAFVFKQFPVYDTNTMVFQGQSVDFYLTLDSNKLPGIELFIPDTLVDFVDTNAIAPNE